MGFGHSALTFLGKAASGVHAGKRKLAMKKLGGVAAHIEVSSPAFSNGFPLPPATLDGPPALAWGDVPRETRSIAVVVEDPDAPFPQPFVHWLVWGIPPSLRSLDADSVRAFHQGENSMLKEGWTPPAPPPGHGVHHYHFQVFALDAPLHLESGEGRRALFQTMRGHVVAIGDLVGTFERK